MQRGIEQGMQQSVIGLLKRKFTNVPPALKEEINKIKEMTQLQSLLFAVICVNFIEEFQQLLNN